MPPAPIGDEALSSLFGTSTIIDSVAISTLATDIAVSKAMRTTYAGSITPAVNALA